MTISLPITADYLRTLGFKKRRMEFSRVVIDGSFEMIQCVGFRTTASTPHSAQPHVGIDVPAAEEGYLQPSSRRRASLCVVNDCISHIAGRHDLDYVLERKDLDVREVVEKFVIPWFAERSTLQALADSLEDDRWVKEVLLSLVASESPPRTE